MGSWVQDECAPPARHIRRRSPAERSEVGSFRWWGRVSGSMVEIRTGTADGNAVVAPLVRAFARALWPPSRQLRSVDSGGAALGQRGPLNGAQAASELKSAPIDLGRAQRSTRRNCVRVSKSGGGRSEAWRIQSAWEFRHAEFGAWMRRICDASWEECLGRVEELRLAEQLASVSWLTSREPAAASLLRCPGIARSNLECRRSILSTRRTSSCIERTDAGFERPRFPWYRDLGARCRRYGGLDRRPPAPDPRFGEIGLPVLPGRRVGRRRSICTAAR